MPQNSGKSKPQDVSKAQKQSTSGSELFQSAWPPWLEPLSAGRGTASLRQAHVLQMQRQYGNNYVQRRLAEARSASAGVPFQPLLASSHSAGRLIIGYAGILPGLQREETGSLGTSSAGLKNPRFNGIAALLEILQGKDKLQTKHNGQTVKAIQQALFDMAYPLPRHKVDGKLGAETGEAIRRFREDKGLAPGTDLDQDALSALDKSAPPPGQTAQKSVDYAKLLADNKLTFTVAIGYDEEKWHEGATKEMLDFFAEQGFKGGIGPSGLGLFSKDEVFILNDPKSGGFEYKDVSVEIRFITPSTQNAKEEYAKGMSQDDISIYSGHARYGTGPDFDPGKSAADNFVIGVGSALHKAGKLKDPPGEDPHWYAGRREMKKILDQRKNDLEKMEAEGKLDKDKYQIWFFNACSTIQYLPELRDPAIAGAKNRKNLDIIGTVAPIYLDAEIKAAKAFILSILNSETLDQMMGNMQGAVNRWIDENQPGGSVAKKLKEGAFYHEGFGDNPAG